MKNALIFKTRTEVRSTDWNPKYELMFVQCPVCRRWFNYWQNNDFRGVKLHIRRWATKESVGFALGEIKKMPHLEFWKENTEVVATIPKSREWKV